MIDFIAENDFTLSHPNELKKWIEETINLEGYSLGEILYVFCDDNYLHKINLDFLNHDTFTDIITFDNTLGKQIYAEIYISTERVTENAKIYKTEFSNELYRVMIHGILHLCGYQDKTDTQTKQMREKENQYISKIETILS